MTLGFLEHLVGLSYAFFQVRAAGDLMQRLNSNATVREILSSSTLSALLDGALVVIYLVLLFVISPLMALIVLGLAALQILILLLSTKRQRALMSENLEVEAKSQSYQMEMLTGIQTLKAFGVEHQAVQRFSEQLRQRAQRVAEAGPAGGLGGRAHRDACGWWPRWCCSPAAPC